jgi:hypothetical protein
MDRRWPVARDKKHTSQNVVFVTFLPDELRLAYTVLLNALIFWCAYRLVRKLTPTSDPLQRSLDASLLTLITIYVSVGVPGIAFMLSPISMGVAALALCGGMELLTRRVRTPGLDPASTTQLSRIDRWIVAFAFFFVLGYVGIVAYIQRSSPVLSHDALTYHVPAAIYWLQTHHLGLFDVWFYNPANTYSPLTGSMFIAWLLGPMGNDVLGKFAQAPAMFVVLLGMIQLCRVMGTSAAMGAIIGIAAVTSRPFISQSTIAKDDLWLAAFFLMAMVGFARLTSNKIRDNPGLNNPGLSRFLVEHFDAFRIGAAVGMFFAIKYTALFSLPLFLLLIDAPFRAKWRVKEWAIAVGVAFVLAGPWYVRNWVLTGNPLYPTDVAIGGITFFHGMFTAVRSDEFGSLARDWANLTKGYFQMTPQVAWPLFTLWIAAIVLWLVAALLRVKRELRQPIVRAAVLGPILGLLLYFTKSPYAEMRFIYPSLLLMFATDGLLLTQLRVVHGAAPLIAAALIALFAAGTGFVVPMGPTFTAQAFAYGAVGALVWFGMIAVRRRSHSAFALICTLACLLLVGLVYVAWPSFMEEARAQPGPTWAMEQSYGPMGEAWNWIREAENVPTDAPLAYANTYLLYPLYGFELKRPVFFVPGRPNLHHLHDLPRFEEPTTGEFIPRRVVPLTNRNFDADYWVRELRKSGAKYLFIGKQDLSAPEKSFYPPELDAARTHPDVLTEVFDNPSAAVFQVR